MSRNKAAWRRSLGVGALLLLLLLRSAAVCHAGIALPHAIRTLL
tara:strand:+ start:355 stop:486 length:132 start_codon:yes stop_codon:yes gene_type:complete